MSIFDKHRHRLRRDRNILRLQFTSIRHNYILYDIHLKLLVSVGSVMITHLAITQVTCHAFAAITRPSRMRTRCMTMPNSSW